MGDAGGPCGADGQGNQLINWTTEIQSDARPQNDWNKPGRPDDFLSIFDFALVLVSLGANDIHPGADPEKEIGPYVPKAVANFLQKDRV